MVAAGRLDATDDPADLTGLDRGRGRPPTLLVSLDSLYRQRRPEAAQGEGAEYQARLTKLENEVSRLSADLENVRAVVLRGLTRDDHIERAERARLDADEKRIEEQRARLDADRARREQLEVFLMPDFVHEVIGTPDE